MEGWSRTELCPRPLRAQNEPARLPARLPAWALAPLAAVSPDRRLTHSRMEEAAAAGKEKV